MLRGYRSTVAALGLILAANHAHAKSDGEQPQAHQPVAASLERIVAGYDNATKRAESADQQEALCSSKQYGSSADLCAQWKAADAASDSAWWAWAGGIIGLGSLLGVFAAIGLAFQSNGIARDTAKKQLRAYLDFDGVRLVTFGPGAQPTATSCAIAMAIKNYGQTPASGVSVVRDFQMKVRDGNWTPLLENAASADEFGSIAPTDTGNFNSTFYIPNLIVDAIRGKVAVFRVSIKVAYFDIFEREQALACDFVSSNFGEPFVIVPNTRTHT